MGRYYNVEIGGGNAFAVFDGAELPTAGERQHVNHLALPVETLEEFDAAYQRLKDHGVAVTEIIERGYGKTFYFHDPNGIRLQIELKTKQDADSLEGDPDPVPYVRALLQRAWPGLLVLKSRRLRSLGAVVPVDNSRTRYERGDTASLLG